MSDICPICGLPKDLCVCQDIAKETQEVIVYCDKRRYGKTVTIIEGFDTAKISLEDVARELKTKCAAGGTVKAGRIELQGDHRKKVEAVLQQMGFKVSIK